MSTSPLGTATTKLDGGLQQTVITVVKPNKTSVGHVGRQIMEENLLPDEPD